MHFFIFINIVKGMVIFMKKKILSMLLCFTLIICIIPQSTYAQSSRDTSFEEELATDLKALGLFKGVSDTNFDLNREPTRVEALVMLIRVLGKEAEVLNSNNGHPFTDVPAWADKYVGYAYEKGLTKGTSATTFGVENASSAMYITFILRALGYSDTDGIDFTWDNPYTLAKNINILPSSVDIDNFWRADAVAISHAALSVTLKKSEQTLAEKLISTGVFSKNQYDTYYGDSFEDNIKELSAEQIYEKCSSAVFYIEVYNSFGEMTASGSGFFIDNNGTAITNYHVINGCYSAKIILSDEKKTSDIMGVYDFNENEDWAIIDTGVKNSSYLEIGAPSTVVGGATVFAIGSPLGLQNTISQGLISNPQRTEENVSYIQTSAAISSGSSGGALLNKYGEVIGITSASYIDGQNLNLALPMSYISLADNKYSNSFISVVTGNENSKIKPYNAFSVVPDFGAYNAVPVYSEISSGNTVTYYYSHEDLKNADTYTYSINLYCKVLKEWGFALASDNFYKYLLIDSTGTYSVIYDIFAEKNGVKCTSITLSLNQNEKVEAFQEASAVPDFGHYFGVNGKVNTSSVASIQWISYYYNVADLYNNGHDNFFEVYADLLEDWGFIYEDKDENNIYRFVNSVKNQTINFSANDGVVVLHVIIW